MLRGLAWTSGVLVALVASVALAQTGPGGPGGGPGGRGGMRMSAGMLLAMPEVQKELGISDDQKKQIETAGNAMRDTMRSSFGQFNRDEFEKLSEEERQKRFSEMRKKMEDLGKQVEEKTNKILTAKQIERLNQLRLQREGISAFGRPEVVKQLKLTDEQQEKIKKIAEGSRPQGRPTFDRNQTDEERRAAFAKMREQRQKALKDTLAVLDEDQLMTWGEMWGKDFKFPEFQGFGRRGGQGGGNPPAPKE